MSPCFPPIRTSILGFRVTCITQAALPKARSLTQSHLPRLFPQRRSHYRIWGSGCRNMRGGVTQAALGCQHSGSCRAVVLGPRCMTLSCPPSRCESRSGGACAQDHRGPPPDLLPLAGPPRSGGRWTGRWQHSQLGSTEPLMPGAGCRAAQCCDSTAGVEPRRGGGRIPRSQGDAASHRGTFRRPLQEQRGLRTQGRSVRFDGEVGRVAGQPGAPT